MKRRHKEQLSWKESDEIKTKVVKDFLEGALYSDIVRKLKEGDYGKAYITDQTSQYVANNAIKAVKKNFVAETEGLFELQYNRLLNLYSKCLNDGDRLTAFQCMKELNRLVGFTQNTQNSQLSVLIGKMNGDNSNEITISFSHDGDMQTTSTKVIEKPKDIETEAEIIED